MVSSDQVIEAFKQHRKASGGNYFTDGTHLFLFGNLIAKHMPDGSIHATNAGWATVTTHKALNRLGANITSRGGRTLVRGQPYENGSWFRL